MKIYTRTGDSGQSGLIGGKRVSKCDLRLEAYGTLDELNAQLAVLRQLTQSENLQEHILDIQKHLFRIGAQLATPSELQNERVLERNRETSLLSDEMVQELENEIDLMEASLPLQQGFVIPGGSMASAVCHVCRTVCRRAERTCVALSSQTAVDESLLRFLNRLSDFLFVLSRKYCLNESEELYWDGK